MAGKAARAAEPLIVGISGIRGIVGESLAPEVVARFAQCYGTPLAGGTVLLARDGRTTGPMLAHAVIAGLRAVGCHVADLGVAATPTIGFMVRHLQAAGGIQISASHNPPPWNGLKLFRREGFVLSPAAGRQIAEDFRNGAFRLVPWDGIGNETQVADPHGPHLDRVLSLVEVAAIRRRKFRIVHDANHGAGAAYAPRLFQALGAKATILGDVPDGRFDHEPEPTAENLGGLCAAVKNAGADLGVATDPDADRLALVDDLGRCIGEEFTLALAIRHVAARHPGPVVLNGSTSLLSEEVARAAGCTVHRTPVGEVHVAERMQALGATIGGEGNGGVIDPRVGYVRDSVAGIALVLDLLAATGKTLSALVDEMPAYALRKEKFPAARERLPAAFAALRARFPEATADDADGLRLAWPDRWLQVRASNTEPIVRVFAESRDPAVAAALCAAAGELVQGRGAAS